MSLTGYAASMNLAAEVNDRFVAVILDATINQGCKLPAAFATDAAIGVMQDVGKGASASNPMPVNVMRVGRTFLKMAASSSGDAGDPIKLGNNSGHGPVATLPADALKVFARALHPWESGLAGDEALVEVELLLQPQS